MVVHTCSKCKKEFNKKSSYDYHLNKKYDCEDGLLKPPSKRYDCPYCNKLIARGDNFLKHIEKCKIKNPLPTKNNIVNIEPIKNDIIIIEPIKNDVVNIEPIKNEVIIIKPIKNEIIEEPIKTEKKEDNDEKIMVSVKEFNNLKKEIDILKQRPTVINGNITIQNNVQNNIQNNIQQNIQYNDFGSEDLSKVNLHEILERKADVIPKFLYDLHCSTENPENYNVGIKDKKRYQAYVRLKGEWEIKNKKNVLNELLTKITTHIGLKHLEDCEKIGIDKTENLYKNALKEIKNIDPTESLYEKTKHKETLETIEHVLYVNKDRIFSETKPVIQKRKNYKSAKREDLK